jgi:FkbM family methyltransferase
VSLSEGIRWNNELLGIRGLLAVTASRLSGVALGVAVRVPSIKYPVHVRLRSSDVQVLRDVLVDRQYDCPLPFVPSVIIDAGANIGLTSVFYANRYPNAQIIAVEPETYNFFLLKKNIAPYPAIKPIQAALWSSAGRLEVVEGYRDWGFQTRTYSNTPSGHRLGVVRAVTVDELLDELGLERADLLKLDIEGAETEVFAPPAAWTSRVGAVIVETHDRLAPGCSEAVQKGARLFTHRFQQGELTIFCKSAISFPENVEDGLEKENREAQKYTRGRVRLPLRITQVYSLKSQNLSSS